jgi:DNA helicase-2/ATP-dependent DNA helicase PcrA
MDPLLDGLDARQRDAVTSPANPLAILAPAGAGKTRVLTRRIAFRAREGSVEARHVLAVTFTRKAAGELVDRVGALGVEGVTAGTFHALALAQLRRRALEQHRPVPTVLASKARILGSLARDRGAGPVNAATLSDLAAEIEWAKARLVRPEQYATAARAAGRRPPRPFADVADIYARYESEKRTKRTSDFDDLLWLCADAIEEDPTFAATQRWRFRHVFVDEFQDATPLQLRLLRAWLGAGPDLCVVGDAAQAIYGFAGADATPLLAFADHFPGATLVALDRNYRSTPQVVAVAESILAPDTAGARPDIVAVRPGGPAPTTRAYADDAAEATGVAQGCWEAFTSGVPWSAIGVLFRTNAPSSLFEAALARRGIPCRVPTGGRFVERPAVPHTARPAAESRTGNARPRSRSCWPTSPWVARTTRRHPDRRGRTTSCVSIGTRSCASAALSRPKAARATSPDSSHGSTSRPAVSSAVGRPSTC